MSSAHNAADLGCRAYSEETIEADTNLNGHIKETRKQKWEETTTSKTNTQVKIPWYRNQYNKLDSAMAYYRQETESSGRWGGFKLETSFEWGTTRICTRAYLVFNIHQ